MTCWRRLREWQETGVWERLHQKLLQTLADADRVDWTRASLDASSVPAPKGGKQWGRTQRIGANRERSAILWSSAKVFP
jgi:transposase